MAKTPMFNINGVASQLLTFIFFLCQILRPDPVTSQSLIPDNVKVTVFVGTHADAVLGKTPWGEIAEQLGEYEIIKEHDKKHIPPGKERLRKVLEASGPTLILMDEILFYVKC